jgi:hypothetical protein
MDTLMKIAQTWRAGSALEFQDSLLLGPDAVADQAMSYRIGHPALSANGYGWLATLADPLFNCRPPKQSISADEVSILIDAASAHGVLPAVARNLKGALGAPAGMNPKQSLGDSLHELDRQLVLVAGHRMLLMHHAGRIAAAIDDRALDACIIKGPVFARRLYPQPDNRSFSDIDILATPSSVAAIGDILRQRGFTASDHSTGSDSSSEQKWLFPGNDIILIEVQTDVIHSARRKGIRLRHADLVAAGAGDPEDATALLLLAAVHGIAGHQFERLQPAIDVLQAVRGAAGSIDAARLVRAASQTGAMAALQTALDVVSRLFDEKPAMELADQVRPTRWRGLRNALLTPQVVLRSQAKGAGLDSWRRRAIRKVVR